MGWLGASDAAGRHAAGAQGVTACCTTTRTWASSWTRPKTDKGSKALPGATVKAVGSLVELTLPDSKWSGSSIKLKAASEGQRSTDERTEAAIAHAPAAAMGPDAPCG